MWYSMLMKILINVVFWWTAVLMNLDYLLLAEIDLWFLIDGHKYLQFHFKWSTHVVKACVLNFKQVHVILAYFKNTKHVCWHSFWDSVHEWV